MRPRIGLKALGVCALLVGAMAISAGGAQAAEWMKNGVNIGINEPEPEAVLENNDGTLLTKINGLSVDILCTAANFSETKLMFLGQTTNGRALFKGCKTFKLELLVKIELACHVHTSGRAAGEIQTKEVTGQLELSSGAIPIVVVRPLVGEEFARILTEKCVLPETIPVIGKLALKDCEKEGKAAEEELETHLIEEFQPETNLFVINKTEMEHLATLDGSALVKLVGGGKWSGLAG